MLRLGKIYEDDKLSQPIGWCETAGQLFDALYRDAALRIAAGVEHGTIGSIITQVTGYAVTRDESWYQDWRGELHDAVPQLRSPYSTQYTRWWYCRDRSRIMQRARCVVCEHRVKERLALHQRVDIPVCSRFCFKLLTVYGQEQASNLWRTREWLRLGKQQLAELQKLLRHRNQMRSSSRRKVSNHQRTSEI